MNRKKYGYHLFVAGFAGIAATSLSAAVDLSDLDPRNLDPGRILRKAGEGVKTLGRAIGDVARIYREQSVRSQEVLSKAEQWLSKPAWAALSQR